MFQFEDFDMSGIMSPELVDVMEMRKEANLARGNATDQYEADVADFKNIQATEAEQGIASLPNAPFIPNIPTLPNIPNIDYTNLDPTIFGIPFTPPDINFEDIDISEILPDINFEDIPINLPDIPTIPTIPPDINFEDIDINFDDIPINIPDIPEEVVTNPYEEVFDTTTSDVDIPVSDNLLTDPETGGDLVLVVGTPDNPGPGVVVRDPETGDLPPGFTDEGPVYPPGTTPPEIYTPPPPPPPPPPKNPYTGRDVVNPYTPYELPMSNPSAGYTPPMDPSLFGSTPGFEDDPIPKPPGMKFGGRVPMGNNNMLNSGLSRLPLNQQNDTLTQVFQSGFRPRR